MEPVEYRAVITFLYLKGCIPKEAFGGENAPSYNIVKLWLCQFKYSRTSVKTVPIHGRPQSAIDDATIQ